MSVRGRLRAGDPDVFRQVFDDCARAVYNHAFRLTANWSTAEDVVALTFLEAWRLRHRVEPHGGTLLPWLLGIATNVARNVTRAARRYDAALSRLPRSGVMPDFADELVERIDDKARIEVLHDALGKLRRAEQEVFALCVWAGLDYAAAASALGWPVGTVRSRLSRAKHKLRKILGEEADVEWEPGSGPGQEFNDRNTAARPSREMSQ